jgi:hypothetical protein
MHMMQWNETDLMAFFEVFPTIDENDLCHEFLVQKDDLELSILVYQYEGEVVIRLFKANLADALFELPMRKCLIIRHAVPVDDSPDYLEFITGYRQADNVMTATGVRVAVKPQIRISVL